ncbi:MAG: hypothetical protein GXO98_01285 [Nitrospirae bacterium]|nr:hypothetical protein [Nitrospirota bacterium]
MSVQTLDNYQRLIARVRKVRSAWRRGLLLEGLMLIIISALSFLALSLLLDNFFHLPAWGRSLLLAIFLSLILAVLLRTVIPILSSSFSDEKVAVHIEKRYPELHNRLINAIQLGREGSGNPLIEAIIEESLKTSGKIDLGKAVSRTRLKRRSLFSLLTISVILLYGLLFPNHFHNALTRFLSPGADIAPLTLTGLTVLPGNLTVLSGDDVEVKALLSGRVPRLAQIAYKIEGKDWELKELRKDKPGEYIYTFREVSKKIGYYLIAGDAKSPSYTIRVKERPGILNLKVSLKYPDYTGLPPLVENNSNGNIKALKGTRVELEAKVDKAVEKAEIIYDGETPVPMLIKDKHTLKTTMEVSGNRIYNLHITDTDGYTNKDILNYSLEAIADYPPSLQIINPGKDLSVEPTATVPLKIRVTDDYGIKEVSLLLKLPGKKESLLSSWEKDKTTKTATCTYTLSLTDLGAKPGQVITYYARARDWNDISGPGIGRSRSYTLTVLAPEKIRELGRAEIKSARETLLRIIEKQEVNRKKTGDIFKMEVKDNNFLLNNPVPLKEAKELQVTIRELTRKLADSLKEESLPLKEALDRLVANEMFQAIKGFKEITDYVTPSGSRADKLTGVIRLQESILRQLKKLTGQIEGTEAQLEMQNLFGSLEAIIKKEKEIKATSTALRRAVGEKLLPQEVLSLQETARAQEGLAQALTEFQADLKDYVRGLSVSKESLAPEFSLVADKITEKRIPSRMMRVASYLNNRNLKEALPQEETIIEDLEFLQKALQSILLSQAEDWMKNFQEALKETKERLEKLTPIQESITELTEQLNRTKDLSEAEKAKVGKMAEMQEKMKDVIEQSAEDLKLFPESPISNELLTQMREIYADVEKAIEAKDMKAIEIAVARDEAVLEALKSTTKRVEDFEMWLPDEPDNIKWNLESFDPAEIPEIPLVDLPDELEDLVGELIESQKDANELTDDATSNWVSADMPMGWGVAAGGISNFSAKGKSGNRLPNSDEITGRSGAGRSGKTSGELVENFAKDLEGSPTPPRRTSDPYQKGHVEEENPSSPSGATGGGKQSGYGEEGFSGLAPAQNELALQAMARRQSQIRFNTQNLRVALDLLFLPSGDLDNSLLLMEQAEKEIRNSDLKNLPETQKLILHSLKNTYRYLTGNTYIQLDAQMKIPRRLKEEILDARDETYPPEYKDLISEYYKVLSQSSFE